MIPYGFGDPITSFENSYRQTDPDTPYLTVGHTPWSTSSRRAFTFAPEVIAFRHRPNMVLGRLEERHCFYIFFFTGVDPVHALGHGHGPVLGVVAVADLDWTFGWTYGVRKVDLPHLRTRW